MPHGPSATAEPLVDVVIAVAYANRPVENRHFTTYVNKVLSS